MSNFRPLLQLSKPVDTGDFEQTRLTESLENLEIDISGKPQKLIFPPVLIRLKLTLPARQRTEIPCLDLPKTLRELVIANGRSTGIDWKLPRLKELDLTDFKCRLKVPPSVRHLNLHFQNGEHLNSILLAQELDWCSI